LFFLFWPLVRNPPKNHPGASDVATWIGYQETPNVAFNGADVAFDFVNKTKANADPTLRKLFEDAPKDAYQGEPQGIFSSKIRKKDNTTISDASVWGTGSGYHTVRLIFVDGDKFDFVRRGHHLSKEKISPGGKTLVAVRKQED
jgi:hypothetical protein